jgi:hypothetical protein
VTGAQAGTLSITTTGPSSTETAALSGTGVVPTALSTTTLGFGNVAVNTTSATKVVGLVNVQSFVTLNISSLAVSSGYTLVASGTTCPNPGTLAPGASCTIGVAFAPTAPGADPGTLTIKTNANNSPQTVTLSGTGIAAATLTPTGFNYGNVSTNTTSAVKAFTFKNNQSSALTIGSVGVTAGTAYAIDPSTTCSGSLAAGASCTVGVTFAPTVTGAQAGTLSITTTGPSSTETAALSGTGVVPTALSTTTLNFGSVAVNTTSATKVVGLVNVQSFVTLNISSLAVSSGYVLVPSGTTCPNPGTLAPGASCTIGVAFAPTAPGADPGTLTITTNANNSPQTVTLGGTGIAAATLTPTGFNYGNVSTNTTSAVKAFTFKNNQSSALTIGTVSVTTGTAYAIDPSTTCSGSLAAGASCTVGVTFAPTVTGAQAGTLSITTTGPSSTETAALSGTGVVPTALSTTTLGFGSVAVNTTSATKVVGLVNVQSFVALNISSLAVSSGYVLVPSGTTCPNPGTLAPGANCTIGVAFAPTAPGADPGTLTIKTNANNSPQTVTLSGTGTGISPVTVSPTSLDFGSVATGWATSKTVTVTNNQSVNLSFTSIVPTGPFVQAGGSCTGGVPVAPGASCTIQVQFSPTNVGATSGGQIAINDTASNSPQIVTLSGTGILPLTILPASLDFGSVAVGSNSSAKTVTVTNNQPVNLSFTSMIPTGPFVVNSIPPGATLPCTGGVQVPPGASCIFQVYFQPTTVGATSGGQISINDTGTNSPQVLLVSGTGVVPVTVSPTSLDLGNVAVGATSAAKTVTLTNNQAGNLLITSVLFGGPFVLDTGAATTCPTSGGVVTGTLAGGASCAIGIDFKPTVLGSASGQITVIDTATNSPQFSALSGTGVAPVTLSASTVDFGNVTVNTTSTPKSVTLTNNQSIALNFTTISAPAPYAVVPGTTTCVVGTPVAAGGNCVISMTYSPTSVGATPASTLTISDDAPSTPQIVNLTGSGVGAVTLSPASLDFGTVVVNVATVKSVTLTNNQASPLVITSITGFTGGYTQDSGTTCPLSPLTVPTGGSCAIAVSLKATGTGSLPGTITIADNAPGGSQTFALSANAIPQVMLSPGSLTFDAQYLGTTSAAKMVTLTNEQNIALNITSITITGTNSSDFGVTSSCPVPPSSLPATTDCWVHVTFAPTASGTRTAALTVADDATGTPQTITLTGSGNAPVTILPTSITNFTAPVGSTSAYQTLTITNSSTNLLHISGFQLSGDFIQTSTDCPMSPAALAVSASCHLAISFDPTIGGVRGGQLQVVDDAFTTPQVINLSGTGTSPLTISPGTLSFSAQTVGTTSAAKTITLTNHEQGGQPEPFTLVPTGDYTASTNCTTGSIAPNSSCLIYVSFAPSSATPSTRTGSLTIANTAPGGSGVVASLTGSAITTNPPAAVAVVSPGAGAAGTSVNVVITGNGWTHFSASSVISFSDINSGTYPVDIAVTSQTFVSANEIDATLALTGGADAVYGARNISVATPLTGGGTETAELESAFILADPSSARTIVSLNPAFSIQGQTLNVDITAIDTNFVDGTTYANFGDGVTINSLSVSSLTTAHANITVSNTTPIGYRTITLVTGGEFATSGPQAFYIGPNSATLLSISPTLSPVVPTAEPQGWSGPVYLTASGTHFLQKATQVSFTGGILSPEVTVTSPTTAVVQVAVPANATIGLQNATVSTGGEIASLNNAFTVIGATPGLVGVSPSSGQQGQTLNVVITGNAYTTFPVGVFTNPGVDPILADFTGEITVNSITVNAGSTNVATVNITVSPNANVGGITARLTVNPSGPATIFAFGFSVTASSASITSVSPACIPQGGQLTLTVKGLNTLWVQGTTTASFYPVPIGTPSVDEVTITDATDALLAVAVPTNTPAGTYGFYMATGGQVVSASVNVCSATPSLTMSPANGLLPSGSSVNSFNVSFTGQNTHFGLTTLPIISGEGVTLTGFSVTGPMSATGTINIIGGTNGTPTATGPRLVTFTTGGEIVTTYFNVTQTPVALISISPYHAAQSTTVDVSIVGLNTHFTTGMTQVLFGPQITVNSVTVINNSHLTANITTSYTIGSVTTPTPPGWLSIYVNTGAEQLIGGFLVDSPAQPRLISVCVTGVVPCLSSAQQGATVGVTITGSLTHWVQGTTEAILGAGVTVSNLQILSPTVATATIAVSPTAPVGGNSVIMITGSEIVSGTGFSVTPNAALIQSVEPNFICPATGFNVNGFNCTPGNPPTGIPVISQLQTNTLNIVGVGTHWLQGETTVNFGQGVVIDSLTVSSPTTAQVQITVLSTSPVGFAALTTTTDGEVVTLQQAIDIEEGFPKMLATSPSGAMQGATLDLQVLGRFTNWQQGVTSAAFNQDITVNSVNVIDSDNLILNITVNPTAYVDYTVPCGHVLTITTGTVQVVGSIASGDPGLFCVAQGPAQINSVSPLTGKQGSTETVTITGSFTHFIAGVTNVSFGDSNFQVGQITVNSTTSLTVPVAITTAATTGYKTITVTTYGEVASQQYSFTVTPGVGTLNEAIPNLAEQGAPLSGQPPLVVRLIGQYTHFSSLSTATFGTGITVQSISDVSDTEVDATINIDPLSYTGGRVVTVTTPGVACSVLADTNYPCQPGAVLGSEIVSLNAFSIIPGPAIISNVTPNTGNEGQEVVFNITGSGTHWAQNFTQFYIAGGGYDLTIHSVVINSPSSATVDMTISPTANPGARSVYMVTNGESLTDSGAFVVTGGVPVITYLSPNSALRGTAGLQVTINGLYTHWAAGSTTVDFGPGVTVASFQVDDETHIEALVSVDPAAQLGYRTVQVTTTGLPAGTQILTSNFQVTAPAPPPSPYIWYESPSSGLPGQTFTITFYGANTHWDPNPTLGTQLTGFNSDITINTFQVTSPTSAVANITISPTAKASVSDLTLTTNTISPQEVDTAQFQVVVAQPYLNVVDPGSAMQGSQNLTVNILGQFTNFDSTTTFTFGQGITVNGPPTILGPGIATQSISIDQLAILGGRSVVATTEGTPVGGAGFTVTPSLALISAVTPNTAKQGDTAQIEITGQNTHWSGSTVFQFGSGIIVTKYQVNSATDATVWIAVPALASEGPTYVTATTLGEVANINNGFVIQPGTPYLLSSGPGSLPQQSSAMFTILSQATTWTSANPPVVSYGPGVVLTNVIVTGPTSMTVDGYVQPTTNVGWRNLTVTTGTQILGLNYAFYVSPGPAVINSVIPSTGGQGATLDVTINGTNTHWLTATPQLSFPNVLINGMTVNTDTSISANITINKSAPAGQESLTATTLGEVATGTNVFTITQTQPELLGAVVSPGTCVPVQTNCTTMQGESLTINLTGAFTSFTNASIANFGAGITVNSVTAFNPTQLQVHITISPTTTIGPRDITVTSGTEVVTLSNGITVTTGPAGIVGPLTPSSGAQNQPYNVQVVGSQTHFLQGATTANFGPYIQVAGVTVTDLLHATVAITIPSNTPLGAYDVSLTTGGEVASILSGFTVTSGSPQISSVNPPTGHQGDAPFDVTLTGLFTHFVNGTSVASFGAGITVGSTTASDATHAIAHNVTIAQGAILGSRNVTVITGPETASITGGFTVLAGIPALVSASPNFAQAGTTTSVVVTGQFTTFQAGFSSVSFGSGVTVNFISNVTTTQLTANITVASNATVGSRDVTVTTNGSTQTLGGGFSVTAGTPVITQISPNFGNPGQTGLTITITGQYTNWTTASTVTIGTPSDGITVLGAAGPGLPGPVVTATATSITVNVNIDAAAPLGPAGVSVSGSTQPVPGGFTVQAAVIPAPSILSISPGMNAGGVPINSNFYVVFSQPMDRTTFTNSNLSLRLTSNSGQGWITIPIGINVDATGRVLTLTPNSLLAVNSQYYLTLTNGITDATAAHNSINYYGQYFNTVFSANTTAPTVTLFNPPALSTVGTNVPIELAFSTDMNQQTQTGMTVSGPGGIVAGTFMWNSNPYGSYPAGWGPGTVLFFTPTTPLAANTTYTVSWGAPLVDTAGNAVTPGSFTFNTGSGADTTTNGTGSDIANGLTNVGTNVAPQALFSKPINPLYVNSGTLLLYNADSGKYVQGTVAVAPNGMSATFTPLYPLLPDTYYRLYMAWGYYDADGSVMYGNGAYLNGINTYFTTGNGSDLTAPDVASISPANSASAVPLNTQVIVHFDSPIDPAVVSNIITVTPAGGSAINGTAALASDLVTMFFVPTNVLAPATVYTVQVSGYQDVIGNVGTTRSYMFTTMTSIAPLNVSTGLDASGNLITTGNTADAHWSFVATSGDSGESNFLYPGDTASDAYTGSLKVVAPSNADWSGGWDANGPNSSWIAINPNSGQGNTYGFYSTTFNLSGPLPAHLCLTGYMSHDDNGLLAVNGTAIMGDQGYTGGLLVPLNIEITSHVTTGTNYLIFGFGSTDNWLEGLRLQASIQTCGATLTGGLSLQSATPVYGAGGVATNSTIQLVFNNPLDPATVNSTTLPVMVGWNSNAEIAGTYTFSTTNVSNDTVTFTPDTPFPTGTQIWVGAYNGPYDLAGDSAANGVNNYTQLTYFNTASTVAPGQPANTAFQVTAFSPAFGATNVGLRTPVVATFNRSLNFGTINSNDYALFYGDQQSPWCSGGSYSHSQDGTSIQFNCGALPSSTTLTAYLGSGLQDWNGAALTPYTSQFSTSYYDSNTNGSVISTRPGNGASGVDPNLPIVLYSNLPINAGTANSGIEVAQNNVAVPGTVQVLDSGYALEFIPSVPWAPGALIQWWTTGSLLDTTYNTPINSTSGYFYVAASTATATPTVQVASPATYTNPVPLNTIFDLQFNTPLNPSTVNSTNVYVFDNSNGNIHIPVTLTQPQPNEILMVPTSALPANHYLYVYIGTGLQSTTSVPASSNQWWEYTGTTADSTLPTVTSAVPFNGASGIGVNVSPGVVFSKSIDPVSVNSNTFQVLNGDTPLVGSYWFNSGNTRVEFVPNASLPANTSLTMMLNGVLDQVGNPVTFSSTFQTGAGPDFTAPSVVWISVPSNGSVPTNSSVTIQFSESMDVTTFNSGNLYIHDTLLNNTIAATLTWNSTQSIAYLVPTSPLAAGRQYYLYVNSGTDLAGNQVNGYGQYLYAELSSTSAAPAVINFNPINGATGLGTNTIIEAQFSDPIDPNTLTGVTLSNSGGTVTTSPVMSAANTVLQLVPSIPLAPNTIYTMTIAGVKDPAGNTVATVTDTFTTGATYDITAPTVVTIDPPNYATVGTNAVIKIVFNKPLNPLTVNNSSIALLLNDTSQWIPLTVTQSASGLEVTLTPQIALLPNTEYRYYVGYNNYVQDQDGNNISAGWYYFYTGSGAVTSHLMVTSVSPTNTATGIPLNAQAIITLSAPMDPTSVTQNSIQLFNGATPVAGTVNWVNAQELSFAPTSVLAASTVYTVEVAGGGITDANGNAVTPFSSSFTTGSAVATGGLTFTGSNIGWGATVTDPKQPIVLQFSQILNPATVNGNTLQVMVTWNSNRGLAGTYTVNGYQVTFTPSVPYPSGAQIYVGECGGPTDVLGEVFQNGSCYSQQLVMFYAPSSTVGAPTSLTVLSVSPANGATNVRHDQPVSVTFNNPIYNGSAGGYNTQLYAGQDLQTNGSVSWSADGRTMTFNVGALYNGATYTIAIPAGGVTDEWGNSLASPFISTFITAVNPATGNGSVQGVNPTWNASGVPTNNLLTLYMNRQVDPSTLQQSNLTVTVNGLVYAGTVAVTAGGYEIQYTPTVPFPNGAAVQWWFSGTYDVYGDVFNSNSGYFYTAAAVNPATASPQVVMVSPWCCGASGLPTNANVDIAYNLPIDAATLSGNVYINSGPATPYTVGLVAPNVVRITPSTPWNASTWYGFCTNSNVKGTNGINAQSDCWATYFTVGTAADTTSGTVTIGPPSGVVNVGTNAYIRLQFSKPVDATTINSTNVAITTGGNSIPGTWSFNSSSGNVYGANFSPVNPLPPSSQIQVIVSGLLDYAGNTFGAASSTFTTAATPDYSTPSVSMDFSYWQSGISTTASFSCRYSEAMDPSSVTSGNTYIYSYVTNGNIPVTYTWSADLMTVTMTPVTPLFANSQYVYYCQSGIDLTGNSQNNASAGFYTGNGPISTGPVLLYANPPNGTTNVPVNTNNGPWYGSSLGLLFNEPIAGDSLGNITLTPAGGSPMPIGVYPEYGNTIVWVQLPWALSPNTQYTYSITGVTDMSGNVNTPATSTFTTGSSYNFSQLSVASTSPANGVTTTGLPTVTSITFNEAMDPVLMATFNVYLQTHNTHAIIPVTLSFSADYTTVYLTPTVPLARSTIYDLVIYGNNWWPYDIAGNGFNSSPNYLGWNNGYVYSTFTTGTVAAVDGACGSANGGSFSSPPTTNLCSAGTASAITNPGSWTWSCNGQYGGTTASCSATVTLPNACYPQQSGLVSWWKGDDDATDHMGLNNGTLENGAGFALGEVRDALSFNGSNQYVLIGQPVPTSLQIQNNITLSAWIYPTAFPTDYGSGALGMIVGSQMDGSYGGTTIFFDGRTNPDGYTGIPTGHIHFQIGDGSNWHSTDTSTQLPLNQWTLVTATRTAGGLPIVYYNGVSQPLQTGGAWSGAISYPSSDWFAIGQQVNENRPFTGYIDEVQIYNTALTAAQVQGIYNAGSAGVCP